MESIVLVAHYLIIEAYTDEKMYGSKRNEVIYILIDVIAQEIMTLSKQCVIDTLSIRSLARNGTQNF